MFSIRVSEVFVTPEGIMMKGENDLEKIIPEKTSGIFIIVVV